MSNEIDMFGEVVKYKPKIDKDKRNWENRFQNWSNKQFHNGRVEYGACGYGSMCDYCEDNSFGRPCIRALNNMLRERKIVLDYENITFEEVWDGEFEQRESERT